MEDRLNGNRTMTLNDVIKLVVFVVTLCGYGYAQQLRMERLENTVNALRYTIDAQTAKIDKQQDDIEAWKRATVDLIFKPRGAK